MIRSLFGLAVTTAHLLAITTTVTASYSSSSSKNYGSSSSSSGYASSSSSSVDAYGVNFFAESTNSLYDGYQQAWRYLGWYVDCGNPSGRYSERASHASHDNNNKKTYGNMYCQRYLMWAAVRDRYCISIGVHVWEGLCLKYGRGNPSRTDQIFV
jgi:hypothetical protein